ncbi:hypothetical protein [Pseudomonas prosekii]|nr:hypothetical protein [Pseudomonas prosekii]
MYLSNFPAQTDEISAGERQSQHYAAVVAPSSHLIEKVNAMQYFSAPVNPQARRNIALECNRHLFEDAHQLSREAFELLEKAELDAELFTHYQALRQKADMKFEEAIEHLRLIEEELPSMENVALLSSKSAGQGFDSRV